MAQQKDGKDEKAAPGKPAVTSAAEAQAKRDAEVAAQAANTQRLMDEAAEKRRKSDEEAAEKVREDTARAEEESARAQAEADARARQELADREQREADEAADKIAVTVPHAFRLNLDNHKIVDYPMGTYGMPRAHADHWWSKAHGVLPFEEVVASVKNTTDKDKQ